MAKPIDAAVAWAVMIANDDSHGYDQNNRDGPDYDCSSLLCHAWERAGVPVMSVGGASYTGDMYAGFTRVGFDDVTSRVNFSTGAGLAKGDVLLRPGHHTEMMCDATHTVGAHNNELGGVTGGKTGDQTGDEISVQAYRNKSYVYCLRYPGGSPIDPAVPPSISKAGSELSLTDGAGRLRMYCYDGVPGIGIVQNGESIYWDFETIRQLLER